MVKVEFLGPIAREAIEVDAKDLNELADILSKDDDIKEWLPKCAVAVNDEIVTDRSYLLKDGDIVSILPPVCGG